MTNPFHSPQDVIEFSKLYRQMLHLTLSAESPCVEDVLPVLGDTEQVDDGVTHHRHDPGPEQQDLVL